MVNATPAKFFASISTDQVFALTVFMTFSLRLPEPSGSIAASSYPPNLIEDYPNSVIKRDTTRWSMRGGASQSQYFKLCKKLKVSVDWGSL